jgi:transcriptional regulator with XRE-family HTH domain
LSQRELAELADLSRVAVTRIENGTSRPYFSTERRLAAALGYEVEEVFPWPGNISPSAELRDWYRALTGEDAPTPNGQPKRRSRKGRS